MIARALVAAAILVVAVAGSSGAALPPDIVDRVERYLNDIDTLKARFTQIAPDGRFSEGRVYIDRPGRLRFEYEPPERMLIVATDWRVVMHDPRSDQTTTVPVERTPLGLLLEDDIRLSGDVTIRGLAEINDELHLTVFQTDEPGLGQLELVFGMRPLELRRWQVLDAQGKTTQVNLEDVELNVPLESGLFSTARLR